jgi:hypothetical protein
MSPVGPKNFAVVKPSSLRNSYNALNDIEENPNSPFTPVPQTTSQSSPSSSVESPPPPQGAPAVSRSNTTTSTSSASSRPKPLLNFGRRASSNSVPTQPSNLQNTKPVSYEDLVSPNKDDSVQEETGENGEKEEEEDEIEKHKKAAFAGINEDKGPRRVTQIQQILPTVQTNLISRASYALTGHQSRNGKKESHILSGSGEGAEPDENEEHAVGEILSNKEALKQEKDFMPLRDASIKIVNIYNTSSFMSNQTRNL